MHSLLLTIIILFGKHCSFTDVSGCPVNDNFGLRVVIATILSLTANVFFLAIIVGITIFSVKRRKSQRDLNTGSEGTENTVAYEEIELHPCATSSTIIDTRENVAYSHNIFN